MFRSDEGERSYASLDAAAAAVQAGRGLVFKIYAAFLGLGREPCLQPGAAL